MIAEKQTNLRKKGIHKTHIEIADNATAIGIDIVD